MKTLKTLLIAAIAAVSFTTMVMSQERLAIQPAFLQQTSQEAKQDRAIVLAQAVTAPAPAKVTTETPAGTTTVTTVKGGGIAAQIIEWMQVAFGGVIGAGMVAGIVKGLQWMGIQVTGQMRAQLQSIVINGINDAAAKAQVALNSTDKLDIRVKSQIIADAVDYTQRHAPDTIKALGLDPKSGEAVEAIRARIETALNDPNTPTPAEITPLNGQPQVNGVVINGANV